MFQKKWLKTFSRRTFWILRLLKFCGLAKQVVHQDNADKTGEFTARLEAIAFRGKTYVLDIKTSAYTADPD